MMDIIANPMLVATVVMVVLCLLKVEVFFSIVASVFVCIFLSGANVNDSFWLFINGMGGNNEIVYGLLVMGMLGVVMQEIKMGEVLVPRLSRLIGNKVWLIPVFLCLMAVLSETVVLIYVTFVPIFIPPFISLFNKYKVDRRMLVTVINAGMQIGYVCIPVGIGAVYMGIVQSAMADNGLDGVGLTQVAAANLPILFALILGVIAAIVIFRKPRTYTESSAVAETAAQPDDPLPKMEAKHWLTLVSAVIIVVVLFMTSNIPLSATCGVAFLILCGVVRLNKLSESFTENIKTMAYGCFILMAAAGFGNVTREIGQLDTLIAVLSNTLGGNKLIAAFFMLIVGLAVTMGIGTSFGTVPIVATILVPLGQSMGMSTAAIIMLVAAAGALGDSGSPASENTLVCTSVFNADGQHDHIRDTCIPAFLCVNIPLVLVCTVAACLI